MSVKLYKCIIIIIIINDVNTDTACFDVINDNLMRLSYIINNSISSSTVLSVMCWLDVAQCSRDSLRAFGSDWDCSGIIGFIEKAVRCELMTE